MDQHHQSSLITGADIATSRVRLSDPTIEDGAIYWLRLDPLDRGRTSLYRKTDQICDLTRDWDLRTSIHAYGGTAYAVKGDRICFNDRGSGQVWEVNEDGNYQPITPAGPWVYGGFCFLSPDRIVAVREDHSPDLPTPRDQIVELELGANNPDGGRVIVSGADFYFSPVVSTSGWIAWMEYDHPGMPWDSTRIMALSPTGELHQVVATPGVSAVYPQWDRDGSLLFLSDQSGYWNFYRWINGEVIRLHHHDQDFCDPAWTMTRPPFALLPNGDGSTRIGCSRWIEGLSQLGFINPDQSFTPIGTFGSTNISPAYNSTSVVGVGSVTAPYALYAMNWETTELTLLESESQTTIAADAITIPDQICWPAGDLAQSVVGWFYNPSTQLVTHQPPPLLVICHGGPTSWAQASFSLITQFFTSRGIAVLDVNYSGSSAMGRAYRQRLYGQWGVTDVQDCIAGACYLRQAGLVDGDRMAIMGGSAGGFTALNALASSDVFSAGVSLYGVADLIGLTRDTTKFESHYNDTLIGPYPDQRAKYLQRSPINQVGNITAPVIILQGQDDPVVPPSQSIEMYQALRAKGLDAQLHLYEGESHGFRMASTIEDAYERIWAFLQRVWGL